METTAQPNSVLAKSPPADEQTRVLKSGADFAVFDRHGDIRRTGLGEEGIYHRDVRYLSRLALRLNERSLLVLGSTIQADDLLLQVDMTNPDLEINGELWLSKDTVHVQRNAFLFQGVCYTRVALLSYGHESIRTTLCLHFESDFADIFEVRGVSRPHRGELAPPHVVSHDRVELRQVGLDRVTRCTEVSFRPPPDELRANAAFFEVELKPGCERELFVLVQFDPDGSEPLPYEEALAAARRDNAHADALVRSSSDRANAWITRSAADVNLLVTQTEQGPYPYAGLPWFSAVFGRDGIVTALMYLWVNPAIARGVLQHLAAHQAQRLDPEKDAEPGKILHEHRVGEMAALGEVPFRYYCGSVDATLLFVVLAEAYYQRTADQDFISFIWPNVQAALQWIDAYGDRDGDGFVEYQRQSSDGIRSQGWKDSDDSISHEDGRLAEPPVALCEVQAYVYAARRAGARLAESLGEHETAADMERAAETLRKKFEATFWCEERGTYALALDRNKDCCKVKASNAGHCLFSGIASKNRARRVVRTLFSKESFSGWGIRTLAEGEVRFNPMSYHNGSIWPHDNAMIAFGLRRYGYRHEVLRIMEGMFGLSEARDLNRMPELFCGFQRLPGIPPIQYPVACAPQAWAAATVFFLLQAALGMEINAPQYEIRFVDPVLPEWLPRLSIRNLRLNDSEVDLSFERHRHDVGVNVQRRTGETGRPTVVVAKAS